MNDMTACITGVTGQTGSYLADLLLAKGYTVYGLKRRTSSFNTERIDHIKSDRFHLAYGDLTDYSSLYNWIGDIQPSLLFNLGGQSHVRISFDAKESTMDITGISVMRALEAIYKTSPKTRFLQASSSEMFGNSVGGQEIMQNEKTSFNPRSPYAIAKIMGYYTTVHYREAYGIFSANSISFNHESCRRTENFYTRKVTLGAARIKMGLQQKLHLGNLAAKRDWSHASDVADAQLKIITSDRPDDYVIASGEAHSCEEFAKLVFSKLDMDYKEYIEFAPEYLRPTEVDYLCGDASKIREELGWEPKYSFDDLVTEMVEHDLLLAKKEKLLLNHPIL